jgi:hypothetical protein
LPTMSLTHTPVQYVPGFCFVVFRVLLDAWGLLLACGQRVGAP